MVKSEMTVLDPNVGLLTTEGVFVSVAALQHSSAISAVKYNATQCSKPYIHTIHHVQPIHKLRTPRLRKNAPKC